ncbi:hypothetical protein DTO166G5_8471 [Paecilomyces variotii]|nr:hypothetical protein DTO166G5_8471 [Paecilomyces variotii]KAJ9272224.1 hypothetical protein DTO212C5_1729 [Paecilomyces variotii]
MAPKSNKRSSREDRYDTGDDFVVDDSNGHGPSKKPRKETNRKESQTSVAAPKGGGSKVDSNGDTYWEISRLRRVTISTFRGKTMVNIREYYEKDGQELPGKKGISLPIEQFSAFVSLLPEIESVLHEKGIAVPRPEYNESGEKVEADKGNSDTKDAASTGRSNIEETSDEDEEE